MPEVGVGVKETLGSRGWQGMLADEHPPLRHAIAIVFCVFVTALVAGPLGLRPIGDAHVVVLIVPVALAALLLGKWQGCAVGALAGVAEMIHSAFQPFDYYERYLSLPATSILPLAAFGFAMGALFALVGRRRGDDVAGDGTRSGGAARMGALVLACALGAALYTLLLQVTMRLAAPVHPADLPDELSRMVIGGKNTVAQVVFHTLMLAVAVLPTDIASRTASATTRKLSVRETFQIWFVVLTVMFFLMASGVAYAAITYLSSVDMNAALSDHLGSLVDELGQRDIIVNTLDERGVLPRDELRGFSSQAYRNIDCDLPGWTQETCILAQDDVIFASTDDELVGTSFSGYLTPMMSSTTYEEALRSDDAVECYQGSGAMISYMSVTESSWEKLGETGAYQLAVIVPSREVFLNRGLYIYLVALVFASLLGAIFLSIMYLLRQVVVQPVDAANETLARITAGELGERVPDSASAEFSSLSAGINETVGALENSIAEANARIDRELAAARAIQLSALPAAEPPFPDISAFDLYATMNPAREVGGDFFDYFELGDDRIGFVVADVSGKGMPAALFMMAAKTAIRGAMETKASLAEAMQTANRSLCTGNEAEMFVTVFAGVLDHKTGMLSYVNAGHNKPLLMHDGAWTWLKNRSGTYMGSFDWIEYKQFEVQLSPGDVLFAYTDGVNEAFDEAGRRYGNKRLEEFLGAHAELHPRRLLRSLRGELAGWARGAEQSDDITMLALKYGMPPEHGASLVTTASLDSFEEIERFIRPLVAETGCPRSVANHVLVSIEELVVNVASYAYPDATPEEPGPLRIHFTHQTSPNAIVVEISDDGRPFNPLAHEDPSRPENIEDASVGGLGLVMTKKFMDEVEYLREGVANVTIITEHWD